MLSRMLLKNVMIIKGAFLEQWYVYCESYSELVSCGQTLFTYVGAHAYYAGMFDRGQNAIFSNNPIGHAI